MKEGYIVKKNKKLKECIENETIEIENEEAEDSTEQDAASSSVEVEEETEELTADMEIMKLNDKLLRTLAEFDNFRKRTQKEKSTMYNNGVVDTITKILPVIDNFERALNVSDNVKDDPFYVGMSMILKQLTDILEEIGVTEIKALGEKFDHEKHSAVMHIEDENYGEGEIIEDLQKGYMFCDKVIRYSMVKVAN